LLSLSLLEYMYLTLEGTSRPDLPVQPLLEPLLARAKRGGVEKQGKGACPAVTAAPHPSPSSIRALGGLRAAPSWASPGLLWGLQALRGPCSLWAWLAGSGGRPGGC
jgi:hypothetical protein